ncbi:MAG: 4Fe-4S binding protein [Bacteroidota bacterium]
MASKRIKLTNYFRLALQYSMVIVLLYMIIRPWVDKTYSANVEAYCPVGGMQAFSSWMVNDTLACSMNTQQIAMGLALLIGIILFSKLFCAYVCPIGIFTEWLGRLGSRFKLKFTIKGFADKGLRILKYALLFTMFYFTITSSELFCRKFDPYYATLPSFSSDVSIWMAISALGIVILGSFFIRQFWCKYVCPMGAVSNIFAFTLPFWGITAVFITLIFLFHIQNSWIYYLGALCLTGFIMEAWTGKTYIFPLVKVTRHDSICTHCKICDKACPYAIDISNVEKVNHIDCTLCGDCIVKCPEKGALTYNGKRLLWLPSLAVVLLIAGAFTFASFTEIATINMKWGSPEQMSKAATFSMDGLKNVKCYGSSMSFATQMQEIKGVLGVQTFVRRFGVKVFYDPSIITAEKIKEKIFSPSRVLFKVPGPNLTSISVAEAGINRFFDSKDADNLAELLGRDKGIFSYETHFGEPVKTLIYFDPNLSNPEKLKALIESRKTVVGTGENQTTINLDFEVSYIRTNPENIHLHDYLKSYFDPYDKSFNGYIALDSAKLQTLELPFKDCIYAEKDALVPYLRNHMMQDKGLLRFQTYFGDEYPMLRLYFIPGKTTPDALLRSLNQPNLHITFKDGKTETKANPFRFTPGIVARK